MPRHIFALFSILFLSHISFSQTVNIPLSQTQLEAEVVASNLDIPWDLTWSPDGYIWFSERNGNVKRMNPQNQEVELIFQVPDVFQSQENSGLHALAIDPGFPLVPYVYLHYTYRLTRSKIVRYVWDWQSKSLSNPLTLLEDIPAGSSHNGSRIVFENENTLFLSLGDAYQSGFVQDLEAFHGKILRMHTDGSIPEDNPFRNSRVWSWGHRNVQGLVRTSDGRMYGSEHGLGEDDELNKIEKGHNYGWPNVKGYCNWPSEQVFCQDSNVTVPVVSWAPGFAPCGLAYYDHPAIPEWRNSLLQVFLKAGDGSLGQRMQQIKLDESGTAATEINDLLIQTYGRLRDVLVIPDGRIYICTSNQEPNGDLVRSSDDDKIIEIRNPAVHNTPPVGEFIPPAEVQVFPNPVEKDLLLQFPELGGEVSIRLLDLTGRVIREESFALNGYTYSMSRGEIQAGTYVLLVQLPSGQNFSKKLIFN
ncbi:MAG: PQQ-dependent sugar dehydrogenase [Bacteroidota bacterium]